MLRRYLVLIMTFILFAVAFVWLSLIAPAKRPVLAAASFSTTQAVILILAVILPYIVIWLIGLLGFMRLREYARLIGKAPEGKLLKRMSAGLLGILLSLPLMSINNATSQVLAQYHEDLSLQIRRYSTFAIIALLLWSFYGVMQSARGLLVKIGKPGRQLPNAASVTFMLLGGAYVFFVLTNPLFENGQVSGHLAPWAVIDGVVLPRMLAWYWGICAVWYLYQYAKVVPGQLYRLAFNYLAYGMGVVTITIILLQYLQAMSVVTKLPLGVIVGLVYLVLIVASSGFILLARGGKELAKIEQV